MKIEVKKSWLSALILLALAAAAIVYLAGQFLSMREVEPIYPGPGVTEIKMLSDWYPGLEGTAGDTEVYVLEGEQEGDKSSEEAPEAPEEQGTAATAPWLINAAGKLLEEAGEGSGAIPVTGLTVLSPRAGEQMAVSQSQQERLETLKKLLSALERAGMLEQVGSIDLTHSTWISMVYRERFEARIPLDKDLDHSLGVLALAVEDTVQTRGEQAAGIMDLTQEEYDAAFTPASG